MPPQKQRAMLGNVAVGATSSDNKWKDTLPCSENEGPVGAGAKGTEAGSPMGSCGGCAASEPLRTSRSTGPRFFDITHHSSRSEALVFPGCTPKSRKTRDAA